MKTGKLLLSAPFLLALVLASTSASALVVGLNPNIHNGTGVPAFDFHLQGVIFSSSQPKQKDAWVAPVSPTLPPPPIFDWKYQGGQFVQDPSDPHMWSYSGTWSGTVPVMPCEIIHIGKYFDVECHNVLIHLQGWWTDAQGNRIVPGAGGGLNAVPLLGFIVEDRRPRNEGPAAGNLVGWSQTLTVQNDTTEPVRFKDYQVAVTPRLIGLSHLMEGDPIFEALPWVTMNDPDPVLLNPGEKKVFRLADFGVNIPAGQFMLMRGMVEDWAEPGTYIFFADIHQAHLIPEPGVLTFALVCGAGLIALKRRRRS